MADAFPLREGEPLKLLVDLVCAEMMLKADQVVIVNQEYPMPKDKRLYVALGLMGGRTFGTEQQYVEDPITRELVEVQSINRQEVISVMAYSSSNLARTLNWQVPLVFTSDRAQQLMEQRSFTIGRVPTTMNDVSAGDGAKRINRFSFTFNLLVAYEKRKPVQYFNKFRIPPLITANP